MTNEDAIKIIRGLLNYQLYLQRRIACPYDDISETRYRLALLHAVKALRHQTSGADSREVTE